MAVIFVENNKKKILKVFSTFSYLLIRGLVKGLKTNLESTIESLLKQQGKFFESILNFQHLIKGFKNDLIFFAIFQKNCSIKSLVTKANSQSKF